MEHKAFLFDFEHFLRDLAPILERSLNKSETAELRDFIEKNRSTLTDPYEGDPLDENWEELIETKDPHQYGDFAMTKYYRPDQDRGLGKDWEQIQKLLLDHRDESSKAILGTPLGPQTNLFDPGKMGSYFQSLESARGSLAVLERKASQDIAIGDFIELLRDAVEARLGIYVTF